MTPDNPIFYIIGMIFGSLVLALFAFMGRLFVAGARDQIVQTIVDSSLNTLLGEIKTGVKELKADMTLVKTAQQTISGTVLLQMQDMAAMRLRLEDHLTVDENFHYKMNEFVTWATDFIKNHIHFSASASPPDTLRAGIEATAALKIVDAADVAARLVESTAVDTAIRFDKKD